MADVKQVQRIDRYIDEDKARKMQTVEVGETGVLLTIRGEPILFVNTMTENGCYELEVVVHDRLQYDRRRSTVIAPFEKGYSCKLKEGVPADKELLGTIITFEQARTAEEAVKDFQDSVAEDYGWTPTVDQILVTKEELIL